jgi:hypothetical protein
VHEREQAEYDPRMLRWVSCIGAVLLMGVSSPTRAQVYRCGESHLYTDKPCQGATAVDVRPNILDAGPRRIPPDPAPAPAVIPPSAYQAQPTESAGSIWDRRDARDAGSRARTGPYRP